MSIMQGGNKSTALMTPQSEPQLLARRLHCTHLRACGHQARTLPAPPPCRCRTGRRRSSASRPAPAARRETAAPRSSRCPCRCATARCRRRPRWLPNGSGPPPPPHPPPPLTPPPAPGPRGSQSLRSLRWRRWWSRCRCLEMRVRGCQAERPRTGCAPCEALPECCGVQRVAGWGADGGRFRRKESPFTAKVGACRSGSMGCSTSQEWLCALRSVAKELRQQCGSQGAGRQCGSQGGTQARWQVGRSREAGWCAGVQCGWQRVQGVAAHQAQAWLQTPPPSSLRPQPNPQRPTLNGQPSTASGLNPTTNHQPSGLNPTLQPSLTHLGAATAAVCHQPHDTCVTQ